MVSERRETGDLGGFLRIWRYLGSPAESGKVFGHKIVQKFSGKHFSIVSKNFGALPGPIRAKSSPDPTEFPKLVKFDFDQLSTSLGDTVDKCKI